MPEIWIISVIVSVVLVFTHGYAWKRGREKGHGLGYLDAKEVFTANISRIPDMIEQSIEANRKHGKGKSFRD